MECIIGGEVVAALAKPAEDVILSATWAPTMNAVASNARIDITSSPHLRQAGIELLPATATSSLAATGIRSAAHNSLSGSSSFPGKSEETTRYARLGLSGVEYDLGGWRDEAGDWVVPILRHR